eukprot:TRINITY_DN1055_c0_g1_i4.p1 TRINITY_DN1055_c0_g1~~TRINITY_DN1055_c0_g1_i4.p1  ORF type:complete len:267 (-),score=88.87 TRINITY_DN1055_c0_g1_i4:329-1129(-)
MYINRDLENFDDPIYSVKAHDNIINCIDGCGGLNVGGGAPEIVTGGRDGCVRVWDPRQDDAPVAELEPEDKKDARDCWSVAFGNSFNDEERCVAAGYDNGDVKLWDLRMNEVLWETNIKNGVCHLQFDRKDIEMNKLTASCLEGNVEIFDMRTFHKEKGYTSLAHKASKGTIWTTQHLPQNREVWMSTSGAGEVALMKYNYPSQRYVFKDGDNQGVMGTVTELNTSIQSTQPIHCWDWNRDKLGLACYGSFDQQIRIAFVTKLNLL